MKLTNQQILELIVQTSDEIAQQVKRMEALSSQIEQSNQHYLSEIKKVRFAVDETGVKESIDIFNASILKGKKTLEVTQKDNKLLLYSIIFCLLGVCSLVFMFFYGVKSKQDIISQYHQELKAQNRVLSEKEAEFFDKFIIWVNKNPKDSQKLFKVIIQE